MLNFAASSLSNTLSVKTFDPSILRSISPLPSRISCPNALTSRVSVSVPFTYALWPETVTLLLYSFQREREGREREGERQGGERGGERDLRYAERLNECDLTKEMQRGI